MEPKTPLDRTYAKLWREYVMVGEDAEKNKDRIPDALAYDTLEFEPEKPSFNMMRKRYRVSVLKGWLYDKIARHEEARMAPLRSLAILFALTLSIGSCAPHANMEGFTQVVSTISLTAKMAKWQQEAQEEQNRRNAEIEDQAAKESPSLSFLDKHWRYSDRELAVFNKLPDDASKQKFKVLNPDERKQLVSQMEMVQKQVDQQEQYMKQMQQRGMAPVPQAAPVPMAPAPEAAAPMAPVPQQ